MEPLVLVHAPAQVVAPLLEPGLADPLEDAAAHLSHQAARVQDRSAVGDRRQLQHLDLASLGVDLDHRERDHVRAAGSIVGELVGGRRDQPLAHQVLLNGTNRHLVQRFR